MIFTIKLTYIHKLGRRNGFLLPFFMMLFSFLWAQNTWEQDKSYILNADTYASEENAFYWKRHLPFPDYWQQDVHYRILANLTPEENKIEGRMTLHYTNHSPDDLQEVYFHLYQNAFTPGSYYDKLSLAQGEKNDYGYHGGMGKGTEIQQVMYNQRGIEFEIDNTLMKITLPKPVQPGQTVLFDIKFTTYFSEGDGGGRRRMKIIKESIMRNDGLIYQANHYDVVHWYPRMVVYDRKNKWNLHQHLGREFYGDFGSFDVHITLPQHYILEGTGVLQNEEEVLPAELKAKINIEHFKDKKWEEIAKEVLPPNPLKTKTWVFHAQNVHDFAFTANPTYRRGEVRIGNVRCIALARESHAARWQDAARFAAKVIEVYSEDFGEYIYPKMVVADADDGMEYPMLTLDGGESPEYYGLLAHEIGHNWFFGMLGTNETYRAFMDEGFTQFAQNWATEKLVGKYSFMLEKYKMLVEQEPSRLMEVFGPYLQDALYKEDGTLNTHSDDFSPKSPNHNYGQVYTKTATMLYDLKYVLGEEVFLDFMKYYVNTWKIKHPYPEDVRQALTDFTHNDFSWFFDQWLETDKQLDYAVARVAPHKGDTTKVMIKRLGQMHQPIEVKVVTKYETLYYYIPNSDYQKPLPESVKILPKWTSIGELSPYYTLLIPATGIRQVIIDPLGESPEINRLNNQRFPKIQFKAFPYNKVSVTGSWEAYSIKLRPSIWWNGYTGLQLGADLRGAYLGEIHKTSLSIWYNTGWMQIPQGTNWETIKNAIQPLSFRLTYRSLLRNLGTNNYLDLSATMRDGRHQYFAEFSHLVPFGTHDSPIYHRFYARYILLYQGKTQYSNALLYPASWEINTLNATLLVGFDKQYQVGKGGGKLTAEARASVLGSQKAYTYVSLTSLHRLPLWEKLRLNVRLFGRYGIGDTPRESALYLAGGSPEEMFASDYYRTRGFFPNKWVINGTNTGNIQYGGGLNLRGYAGYVAPVDGNTIEYGQSGFAANVELDVNPMWNMRALRCYLFADAGVLGKSISNAFDIRLNSSWSKPYYDAGIGFAANITYPYMNKIGIKPPMIRLDLPLYLNYPPTNTNTWAFRWLLSLSKSF